MQWKFAEIEQFCSRNWKFSMWDCINFEKKPQSVWDVISAYWASNEQPENGKVEKAQARSIKKTSKTDPKRWHEKPESQKEGPKSKRPETFDLIKIFSMGKLKRVSLETIVDSMPCT